MGFIREGSLFFVCAVLFAVFIVIGIVFTLTLSLKYENVKQELTPIIKEFAEKNINLKQTIDQNIVEMRKNCVDQYSFEEGELAFTIPCSVLSQGSDAVLDYSLNSLVDKLYYTEYSCEFWDCFKQQGQPYFLFSQKSEDYFKGKLYLLLLASIIIFILIFFLAEEKSNSFILAGILMIVASLPFIKLEWFFSLMNNQIMDILSAFFSKSINVFLVGFILGVVLITAGIIIKILKKKSLGEETPKEKIVGKGKGR